MYSVSAKRMIEIISMLKTLIIPIILSALPSCIPLLSQATLFEIAVSKLIYVTNSRDFIFNSNILVILVDPRLYVGTTYVWMVLRYY